MKQEFPRFLNPINPWVLFGSMEILVGAEMGALFGFKEFLVVAEMADCAENCAEYVQSFRLSFATVPLPWPFLTSLDRGLIGPTLLRPM